MQSAAAIEQLAQAIAESVKAARFCTSGELELTDPGLEVEGLGIINFPLKRGLAKKLIAHCDVAPFGKGTKTLVDTKVRKTFELDPARFRLSAAWQSAINELTRTIAVALGLPVDQLQATLYKLLVYEKGGFFVPHRDSEKLNRMVASLIIVLPNEFQGGGLIVRHAGKKRKFPFAAPATGKQAGYAAFFADCEHEVERVEYGHRLCLTYNLALQAKPKSKGRLQADDEPLSPLVAAVHSWGALQGSEPLVFALEHHYTERGLSLDLLKGSDRQLADLVIPAAEQADCHAHLAQVTRHLVQEADDGSYGEWGRYSRYREDRTAQRGLSIRDTIEDDLHCAEWVSLNGKKKPWAEIGITPASIVSSLPLDDWYRHPRITKVTQAMRATRSIAGITARQSFSGPVNSTTTCSAAPARTTAFPCIVSRRENWPRRRRSVLNRRGQSASASPRGLLKPGLGVRPNITSIRTRVVRMNSTCFVINFLNCTTERRFPCLSQRSQNLTQRSI